MRSIRHGCPQAGETVTVNSYHAHRWVARRPGETAKGLVEWVLREEDGLRQTIDITLPVRRGWGTRQLSARVF